MSISQFSRYADNLVTPIIDPTGTVRATILISPPDKATTYSISTYTWQNGDRIDYLAHSAYGDETQWWRIADVNPEILFWSTLKNGTQIRVPNA